MALAVADFGQILAHVGHELECVTYGQPPVNATIECITCAEVLVDTDPITDPERDD